MRTLLLPLLLLTACPPESDEKESEWDPFDDHDSRDNRDSRDDRDSDDWDTADVDTGDAPEVTTVAATLLADGVEIVIEGGTGGYDFGIAQTNAGAGPEDDWTGEDCYRGYQLGSGDISQNCHGVGRTGGRFYCTDDDGDGDCDYDSFTVPNPEQTLFHDGISGDITFYLADSSGDCWVWGDDPGYYNGSGCTEI